MQHAQFLQQKKTFIGSKVFEFTIYSATGDVSEFDSLRAALASTSIISVKLTRDIYISANKSVIVREGVTFSLNGYTIYNKDTIVNNGKIEQTFKMFVLNTSAVRAKVDGGSVYYNDNNTNCNLTGNWNISQFRLLNMKAEFNTM